jgi:hypothetical protein
MSRIKTVEKVAIIIMQDGSEGRMLTPDDTPATVTAKIANLGCP